MIHFKDQYDCHIPGVPAFKPEQCPPPKPPCQPQPCPPPMPCPMPCVPPAPSVVQGMDLYEAMNGLTDRVNTCIATYNDVMAHSYQALRNLEHAAEANGAYYADCEVSTEQGYYPDEGNTYCITRKKVVDRHGEPIRMQLKLAYDNTTNSALEQPVTDASMIECAQVIATVTTEEGGWTGNCFYNGAPLPSNEKADGYCAAFTRNGTMRVYSNAINQQQLLNDGVENSMSCVGRIIIDGEVKDEVGSAVAPIVAMGQNTVTKEVFFISAGSDAKQVKAGQTTRGLSSKACADILKGYGCDIAVVLSAGDSAMLLDEGENAFVPSTLPEQTKAKAFWYIARKRFYKNDYDRQLAELIQNYGQLRYTALLNELSIINLKDYTEAEITRINVQLTNFKQELETFGERVTVLENKYNSLVERVDTVESDLAQVKTTINTLQQTVQNLIDIVNGMQNTIAKIQQTLTEMENGTVKLPYIEKVDGIGTGTTKLENITVSGDAVVGDLDVKTECWVPSPTQPLQAANKKYVDEAITESLGDGEYLPLKGGTMAGNIVMNGNNISGASQLGFKDASTNARFSYASGALVLTGAFLRGAAYTAPTNNSDYAQKKYVDDTISNAVIEATAGGLTETAANTKYLRLDGTNQPTANYTWNTSLLALELYSETYINIQGGKVQLGVFENPYGDVTLDISGEEGENDVNVYAAYRGNLGYLVTDTYLESAAYLKAAPFLPLKGGTMTGIIDMGTKDILNCGGISFRNGTIIDGKPNANGVISLAGRDVDSVIVRGLGSPVNANEAVNLGYLKEYCEGKTKEVALTGTVDTIMETNTEYTIKDFTALTLVCDNAKTAENHGYIRFSAIAPKPTLTGFAGIDGDDITQAAANEVWEFSCFKGYLLFKNWGVAA